MLYVPSSFSPPGELDLATPHVTVGPYTIQRCIVWGTDIEGDGHASTVPLAKLRPLFEAVGVLVTIARTGVQSGYGHGRETLRLSNPDGSMVYQQVRVNHCAGPGYSCSYDHGPWEKFGAYRGDAPPDPDLAAAVAALQTLRSKFRW